MKKSLGAKTILYPTPVLVVGSYDAEGRANVMVAAWGGIACSIRNLIREDKIHQIYSQMQIGQNKFGMQTMNQALAGLYLKRLISMDDATARSSDPDELRNLINQGAPAMKRSAAS